MSLTTLFVIMKKIIIISITILSVPDQGYSRNMPCALNSIYIVSLNFTDEFVHFVLWISDFGMIRMILFILQSECPHARRVWRYCKSKKDTMTERHWKKNNNKNNYLQNTTHKTIDRTTRTSTKSQGWAHVLLT